MYVDERLDQGKRKKRKINNDYDGKITLEDPVKVRWPERRESTETRTQCSERVQTEAVMYATRLRGLEILKRTILVQVARPTAVIGLGALISSRH